jgi:Tfp pilus assembly protein PilF
MDGQHYYHSTTVVFHPNQSSIHLKYAGFLRHVRRDLKEAEVHYQKAISTNPNNPDALGSYASYLHGVAGNMKEGERYYRAAIEQDHTHANNLCNYGLFLSEEKRDYKEAEKYYKLALQHHSTHANTLYNYAVMLDSHCNRSDDAEGLYERAIQQEPKHAFALYNLAVLREEKLMMLEATEVMEDTKVHSSIKTQRRRAVMELYRRAHDSDPNDATTAADYGRFLLSRMDDAEQSEKVLLKSLELDKNQLVGLYNLGVLKHKHHGGEADGVEKKAFYENAEQLYTKLLTLNPKHAAGLQQMGRLEVEFFKLTKDASRMTNAQQYYERAIKFARNSTPVLLEYLKVSHIHGNNKQKLVTIAFIEAYINKHAGTMGHVTEVRQMLKSMGKIATRVMDPTLSGEQSPSKAGSATGNKVGGAVAKPAPLLPLMPRGEGHESPRSPRRV